MAASQRFKLVSESIDFKKLEKETDKLLFLGLLVAVSFYSTVGAYFMFKKTEVKVVKPPTMELVIRRPRMTKAFEFKKKRVQQRILQRQEFTQQQPSREIDIKTVNSSLDLFGSVTSYEFETNLDATMETGSILFEEADIRMITSREPERQISMKDEMISLDDLDTGQFKAMIIQDPVNKQDISGFVYLANAWGAQLKPPDDLKRSLMNLGEAVNKYTNINAKVDRHLYLDDHRLFDIPFVYIVATEAFELTRVEAENFGIYLRNGGFTVLDNGEPQLEYGKSEAALRQSLKSALGADARFLPIPKDHPVYHCFFDFDDGPPLGSEVGVATTNTAYGSEHSAASTFISKAVIYLEGIWLDERLVAIYCDKGYALKWKEYDNNEPQLKMGVNMVVFGLTQSGSIAQQKMDLFSTGY